MWFLLPSNLDSGRGPKVVYASKIVLLQIIDQRNVVW